MKPCGVCFLIALCLCFAEIGVEPGVTFAADSNVVEAASASDADEEYEALMEALDEGEDEGRRIEVADPLYYWNKSMYHLNDRLYFWVLKPVTRGYKAVTPQFFRTGVNNFFNNLGAPVRFGNNLLQGKSEAAGIELGRFMVNTVAGGLGFWDVARTEPPLRDVPNKEDMGQTLGVWGVGNGFYIVWPVLGPSTLRDTVGRFGDSPLYPMFYVDSTAIVIAAQALDQVNGLSFRLGDYESLKESALDPYTAIRDAYIQYRLEQIKK
jgi:phospholipid-binding lipoprotein MlaA